MFTTRTGQRHQGTLVSTTQDADNSGVQLKDVKDLLNPTAPLKDNVFIRTKDVEGSWKAELLSAFHNGINTQEVERLMSEHPNEPDCVSNGRVLGGIAVTRGKPYPSSRLCDLSLKLLTC